MNNAPERIWLDPDGFTDGWTSFPDQVIPGDVAYIRADLHEAEVAKLRDERDEALTRETIAADAAVGYLERAEKAEAELAALRKAADTLAEAAWPFASPMQNADYGRQLRQFEALVAALAVYRATQETKE